MHGAGRAAGSGVLVRAPTLGFFQLEMEGGIFQSCWSFTVSGRGGECITGTGGEPGPRGTLMCLPGPGADTALAVWTQHRDRTQAQ
jgi:hypothetical protein